MIRVKKERKLACSRKEDSRVGHEFCTRSSEVYYFGDVTGLDTHAWSMDIMIRGLRTDDTSVGKPIKDLPSRGQDRQGGLLARILRYGS